MIKSVCRTLYLEKRMLLSTEELEALSHAILLQVKQTVSLSGKTISLFLPIQNKRELNTYPILQLKDQIDCTFALPVADFQTNEMKHLLYESDAHIEISKYGIPEPQSGIQIDPKEIDIVFVPMVCFDKKGFRVGYGKGFYDRFLNQCRPDCQFIGLSLFEPIELIENINEFDVKLHLCITPSSIYKF